ncbi:small GTPase [Cavenderia fasciculata]|uniref:Small GTPase n=1 Tax=Cavenderia fasciculata TaxID=261658 RepID=F4PR78_CACFS|nr:small GTPase [Cavenderia fasciculata]EGG21278.1 small GTPase [Cavenderia fasciculata]|eukprot:XP_004359128.1 small GTPase [Cavenderia fasciculata]
MGKPKSALRVDKSKLDEQVHELKNHPSLIKDDQEEEDDDMKMNGIDEDNENENNDGSDEEIQEKKLSHKERAQLRKEMKQEVKELKVQKLNELVIKSICHQANILSGRAADCSLNRKQQTSIKNAIDIFKVTHSNNRKKRASRRVCVFEQKKQTIRDISTIIIYTSSTITTTRYIMSLRIRKFTFLSTSPPPPTTINDPLSSSTTSSDITLKALVIGDACVGKSSLIWRLTENIFPNNEQANLTLQNSVKSKAIQFGKKQILVKFTDTAGQERFRTLSRTLYSNTDIVILTYDPTTQSSFENLSCWWKEVERYLLGVPMGSSATASTIQQSKVFIALAVTKCDLSQQHVVNQAAAQEFANQRGIPIIETSSLANTGIETLLQTVVRGAGEKIYQTENWSKLKIKGTDNSSTPNGSGGRGQRSPTMSPTSSSSSSSPTTNNINNQNQNNNGNNTNTNNNNNNNNNNTTNNNNNTNNTTNANSNTEKKQSFCTIL